MRTEHLTKCFEPQQKLIARFRPLNRFPDRSKTVLLVLLSVMFVFVSVRVPFLRSVCLHDSR